MTSLKGRRRGAGASPEDRGKGSELEDKLDARARSCKRTNRTKRLAPSQLDRSQSCREESETTYLSGHLGVEVVSEVLEPCAVKVARTVLRGAGGRKATCLPDVSGKSRRLSGSRTFHLQYICMD